MGTERNYYQIMGLPRTATTEQVKKRYRELARKYHPDVVKDKAFGQKMFVQINEAYKTLVDPSKRASYDLTLPSPEPRHTGASGTSSRVNTPGGRRTVSSRGVETLLRDAQFSFVKRRFNEASNLCRQVLAIDRSNAKAHIILGDIYLAQRKNGQAIIEFGYAVRFDPDDLETKAKLDRLTRDDRPRRTAAPQAPRSRLRLVMTEKNVAAVNAVGWPLVFALLMFFSRLPEWPIGFLKTFHPLLDKWSWNIVIAMGLSSALAGGIMMLSGLLEHPDEELIFDDSGIIPTGIPLLLFSIVFFWGAAAFYLLVGALQGNLSRSVVKVFAAVAGIVLFSGFLYPMGSDQVWLFGGNLAFAGALAGWYTVAMAKPLSG